jgi:hypothetical protein
MSNPFSGIPDPGMPRPPMRRRFQPRPVQEALRLMREALRAMRRTLGPALPVAQGALRRTQWVAKDGFRRAQWVAKDGFRRAQRYGQELWLRGKRNPLTVGVIGGAVALTLVGAYALSASDAGKSLCPATSGRKAPQFRLLMDPVPHVAAGSEVEIHYDVCGLASGTPYRGRVRLVKQQPAGKKKSPKPKALVVSFKDQVDGVATRRHQQVDLASTKPGAYTLELSVADNQGRERKRVQKVLVKAVGR